MWKNEYTSLILNGRTLKKKQLSQVATKQLALVSTELWKQKMYAFILEWLNDKNHVIVNTSGSTGKPKPIPILKENMVHSALATGTFFNLKSHQKSLLCLPCDYIAGKMMLVRAFVLQLNLIYKTPSDPLKDIESSIDFTAMVPLQVEKCLENNPSQFNLIQKIIIGGAPIHQNLAQQIQGLKTTCFSTYGMTETITHIAVKQLNGKKTSEIYEALPNVQCSIDDRQCLVINAPKISSDPVITNDIVNLQSSSQFEWLGRFDNVINSGGIKLFPEKIEQKLSPFITNRFFVTAIPHQQLGKQVILIIEQKPMDSIQLEGLTTQFAQILNKYEKPKKVFFIPLFEETETGKLKRKAILQQILASK